MYKEVKLGYKLGAYSTIIVGLFFFLLGFYTLVTQDFSSKDLFFVILGSIMLPLFGMDVGMSWLAMTKEIKERNLKPIKPSLFSIFSHFLRIYSVIRGFIASLIILIVVIFIVYILFKTDADFIFGKQFYLGILGIIIYFFLRIVLTPLTNFLKGNSHRNYPSLYVYSNRLNLIFIIYHIGEGWKH